jgi:2-dehydro-3-deoxygalactonokinase
VTARLISVDWGTTSLRCYLVGNDGQILDRRASQNGILTVGDDGFERTLLEETQNWRADVPSIPVFMSGMIGSRQGWCEAPYAACPAGIDDLIADLCSLDVPGCGPVRIMPVLETRSRTGVPDVMRGEETQILGALASIGRSDAMFVLPGTHSKWATVNGNIITAFRTYMTGEIFSALKDHTILGRLMAGDSFDANAFERGVAAAAGHHAGDLLNHVFSARTLPLTGQLASEGVESYLSGLLIGAEIRSGRAGLADAADVIHVLGSATLTDRYVDACKILEISAKPIDDACIVLGHVAIADAIDGADPRRGIRDR